MNKKIITSLVSICTVIVLLSISLFAWFTSGSNIDGPYVSTGSISLKDSDVSLYVGNDIDLDDTLDLVDGSFYKELAKDETYSFAGSDMLVPSKKLTYRLIIDNTNDFAININATIDGVTGKYLISLFSIENIRFIETEIDTSKTVDDYESLIPQMTYLASPCYLPDLIDSDDSNYIYSGVVRKTFLSTDIEEENKASNISVSSEKRIIIDFNLYCMTLSDIVRNKDSYNYQNGDILTNLEDFFNNVNAQVYGSTSDSDNMFIIEQLIIDVTSKSLDAEDVIIS